MNDGGFRGSWIVLADLPLADSVTMIKKADELSYCGAYFANETWHKDTWLLLETAADRTKNVRRGLSLSPIALREPTHSVPFVATLDERTGGPHE
jgi:5,10-methylenetetrahydromethanopterin reductase